MSGLDFFCCKSARLQIFTSSMFLKISFLWTLAFYIFSGNIIFRYLSGLKNLIYNFQFIA